MVGEPKNGRAFDGVVTPNAFKNTRSVVYDVRHYMNARVVPIDDLAVFPNLWRDFHGRDICSCHSDFCPQTRGPGFKYKRLKEGRFYDFQLVSATYAIRYWKNILWPACSQP